FGAIPRSFKEVVDQMSIETFSAASDEELERKWQKQLYGTIFTTNFVTASVTLLLANLLFPDICSKLSTFSILAALVLLLAALSSGAGCHFSHRVILSVRKQLQSIQQFLQDASHELATPVAIIRSRLQLMQRESALLKDAASDFSVLKESISRLSNLIDDLRTLAKESMPREGRELSFIPIGELVKSLTSQMHDSCASRGITLATEIQAKMTIVGNREGIERLISNLLSNALRYGGDGGTINIQLGGRLHSFIRHQPFEALHLYARASSD
ncbi:MAG: HAMP domain-containing histidine kinase, partial [Cyanobacteria bacterium]|nr:HAMP domain-containing histidine kinase [Cyanobacteriota bacterium]